ncbi:hypothetical protein DFK10_15120 [Salibaculum griseiflavum]|uniref:Uncharacterized protein n=1 Tax=Salibaculum griseiflavum TaxID=1914409 RepID=A0A2V1NZK8_9RHOB|nr:hypothetical protein DFK10_15120 [Salibaculum griseiflavum]
MKSPNPVSPDLMTPRERRAEICQILALGFVRMNSRRRGQPSDRNRESSLHFPPEWSVHADPTHKEVP